MLKYQLRDSFGQNIFSEYTTTVRSGETVETLEILTETVMSWSGLTIPTVAGIGPQLQTMIGKVVSQSGGTILGKCLWVTVDDETAASGKIGIRLDDPTVVFLAETETEFDGEAFTPGSVSNILKRIGDGVVDRVYDYVTGFDVAAIASTSNIYVDVKNIKKFTITHLGSGGLIRLSHAVSGLVLTPWLRPGQQFVVECSKKYWHLLLEMTVAATPASFMAISHTVVSSDVVARSIKPASEPTSEPASRAVTPPEPEEIKQEMTVTPEPEAKQVLEATSEPEEEKSQRSPFMTRPTRTPKKSQSAPKKSQSTRKKSLSRKP